MHLSFAEYFVDPNTREPLELVATEQHGEIVESGFLKSSTSEYPIVRGIPRFVEFELANYSRSFGYQWHKWPRLQFESENVGKSMAGHTRAMWEKITGSTDQCERLRNSTIVDLGCGPGRFIDVARSKGARVIGIDYSSAVEVAAENFKDDPAVCICQADALKLPIKNQSVDGLFSIGVLHHTPNPEQGVKNAFNAIRSGGWFALSVYGKHGYYDFWTVQMWRKIFKALWPVFGQFPPLAYSYCTVYSFWRLAYLIPPFGKAIRALFPFAKLPDFRWSLLDTFDSVTPSYQSAHESFEVFGWLKRAGFVNVEPTNWGFTSYRGELPVSPSRLNQAA